jgi:PH (Pleckstrin Homology) domain-containing protein
MLISRTPQQSLVTFVRGMLVASVSVWSLIEGLNSSSVMLVIWFVLSALWAVFILLGLVRQRHFVEVSDAGLQVFNLFSRPFIRWDQLTWAGLNPGGSVVVFTWTPAEGSKEEYAGVPLKYLGARAGDLRAAVAEARPDLPDRKPGT